ncbi:HDOD domain-containing protein [Gynuella sunshinyii]|uniref:Putative signal transduction protein n=1 Tax=Gynuella sunshinyii YC6258 TaxID=1445510 RepID=A0A0C5VIW8_9GAMM|nr:HDOD domain-containing protein [Gynuella sunshinyii]AJQ93298.1 putative signal transduction protein [Gynuella sunshinyii YC6258]
MDSTELAVTLHEKLHAMKPFSSAALRAMKELDSKTPSVEKVAEHIAQDVSLTVLALKIANSSFYGFYREVSNLKEVVMILGLSTLRNIIITASLMKGLAVGPNEDIRTRIWRHSLMVACICRYIAAHINEDTDQFYLNAFLHDLGHLVLNEVYPVKLAAILDHEDPASMREQLVDGLSNVEVAVMACKVWALPTDIEQHIFDVRKPRLANNRYKHSIVVAHTLATGLGYCITRHDLVSETIQHNLDALNIPAEDLEKILIDSIRDYQSIEQVI